MLDIQALIAERRHQKLFLNEKDVALNPLPNDKNVFYTLTTERNFASFLSMHNEFFQEYYISCIFDLGEIYSPYVDVRFSLFIVTKIKPSTLKIAVYKESLYREEKPANCLSEILDTPNSYPTEWLWYRQTLEFWLNNSRIPKDSFCSEYNELLSDNINNIEPFSGRYTKRSVEIYQKLKYEDNVVTLKEVADVITPSDEDNTQTEVKLIWSPEAFEYPLKESYFKKGYAKNLALRKGDILLITINNRCEINFIPDEFDEAVFCPSFTTVIRAKDNFSPEFLFLYLRSTALRTIIETKISGMVIKQLPDKEIEELPIIYPKRSKKEYRRIFEATYQKQACLDIFSECYQTHATDTIEDYLNEEFIENMFRCRNNSAKDMIKTDIEEVKKCFDAGAYKATLIMAGSVLEAFLIDWLCQINHKDYFKTDYQVPKTYPDKTPIRDKNGNIVMRKADLRDYIDTIDGLTPPVWMDDSIVEAAHEIRKKRNLVHAKLCLKENVCIDDKLCLDVIGYLVKIVQTRYKN